MAEGTVRSRRCWKTSRRAMTSIGSLRTPASQLKLLLTWQRLPPGMGCIGVLHSGIVTQQQLHDPHCAFARIAMRSCNAHAAELLQQS